VTREVRVPKWGLSIERVKIVEWLVAPGDTVAEGEPLCEVETAKANAEIEAPAAGVLVELRAAVGDECAVGDVVAVLAPIAATQSA
jgi:pyruvate/2-oxoglutarate dehydrogenase complex dihydrolipoamide acyltransferase (E2) component